MTSQKSKASVGRTNTGRRPPSRQQRNNRNESTTTTTSKDHDDTSSSVTKLHRVSRLCHQIHDSAVKQYINQRPSIHERQCGDGSVTIVGDLEANNQLKTNEERSKQTTRTPSTTSSEDSQLIPAQNQCSTLSNGNQKCIVFFPF